jgi:hypothetical protein
MKKAYNESICKGSLVIISGKYSSDGQKLKGGLGVVLSDNSIRYQVLVFAIKNPSTGGLALCPNVKSQIKVKNLTVQDNPKQNMLFSRAIHDLAKETIHGQDDEEALFWLGIYYKYWPDDYPLAITYANLIAKVEKNYKGSLNILRELKVHVPESYKQYDQFCHDFCIACCDGDESVSEGLEMVLKIQSNSNAGKSMFSNSLNVLLATCNRLLREDSGMEPDPEVISVYVRCTEIAFLRDPMHQGHWGKLMNLGAAQCLAGNNVEGAKRYRQALATAIDDCSTEERERISKDLILAQLQCPGMPLEKYYLINRNGYDLTCIHKDDRRKVRIVKTIIEGRVESTIEGIASADVIRYPMPSDPDDPKIFPSGFLRMLKSPSTKSVPQDGEARPFGELSYAHELRVVQFQGQLHCHSISFLQDQT